MSDGAPFGTRQSFQPGKGGAIKLAGSAVGSAGKKLINKVRGDRNLQKQWEFATSVHAHNEGISHHYAMERMSAGHEQTLGQIREQGYMDRLKTIGSGQVARQNLDHAAGVASSMKDRNISMEADHEGGVKFSASKVAPAKKPAAAKPATPAATKPAAPAAEPAEAAPATEAPKPQNVRNNARGMAASNASKTPAAKAAGVTTPKKTAPPKAAAVKTAVPKPGKV